MAAPSKILEGGAAAAAAGGDHVRLCGGAVPEDPTKFLSFYDAPVPDPAHADSAELSAHLCHHAVSGVPHRQRLLRCGDHGSADLRLLHCQPAQMLYPEGAPVSPGSEPVPGGGSGGQQLSHRSSPEDHRRGAVFCSGAVRAGAVSGVPGRPHGAAGSDPLAPLRRKRCAGRGADPHPVPLPGPVHVLHRHGLLQSAGGL